MQLKQYRKIIQNKIDASIKVMVTMEVFDIDHDKEVYPVIHRAVWAQLSGTRIL